MNTSSKPDGTPANVPNPYSVAIDSITAQIKRTEEAIDAREADGNNFLNQAVRAAKNRLYIDAAPLADTAARHFAAATGMVEQRARLHEALRALQAKQRADGKQAETEAVHVLGIQECAKTALSWEEELPVPVQQKLRRIVELTGGEWK